MKDSLARDSERMPQLLALASRYACGVVASLDDRPVGVPPQKHQAIDLARKSIGAEGAFQLFAKSIAPYLSASAGPRHLGFVTGGATPAAVMGDWLVSVFDQNAVSNLDGAAALQVEHQTVRMLRTLFRLPESFEGAFVTGATLSNFLGLAVGREWAGHQSGVQVSREGLYGVQPIAVFSATPHSSVIKALSMLGMGRNSWRAVDCLGGREAVDIVALERVLETHRGSAIVVANAGTVNTGDFDDFIGLAELKRAYGFWLHVDAAFGGFASLSPALRQLLEGWEHADSICIDLHKWLNVPYDSAVAFTRHRGLQVDVFSNTSAYLGVPGLEPEPIHLAPENSHRWRALPAWFTLTAYGAEGHQEIVERNCRLAKDLGERIQQSTEFDLLAPVRLNVVCFALRDPGLNDAFITTVRNDGTVMVTPTVLRGTPAIRAAFSNWRTMKDDLDRVWEALIRTAKALS